MSHSPLPGPQELLGKQSQLATPIISLEPRRDSLHFFKAVLS